MQEREARVKGAGRLWRSGTSSSQELLLYETLAKMHKEIPNTEKGDSRPRALTGKFHYAGDAETMEELEGIL